MQKNITKKKSFWVEIPHEKNRNVLQEIKTK